MKTKPLLAVAVVVVLALAVAYLASPWMAMHELRAAAKAGDRDRLERLVDFPAVRESLKAQLNAQFMAELRAQPDLNDNPFAGLAMLMAPNLVNAAVDALVSADGIAAMIEHGRARPTPAPPASEAPPQARPGATQVRSGYADLDTFRVTARQSGPRDQAVSMVLRRQGLFGWRLVRIDLPKDLMGS